MCRGGLLDRDVESTVSSLCSAVVLGRCGATPREFEARRVEVIDFVVAQRARMPDYLRLGILLATWLFEWAGLVQGGRRFSAAAQDSRWRQVQAWRRAPLGALRDFVRFYESLIVYCWYAPDEPR